MGAVVGRQTPFIALFVPLFLAFPADGRRRGARDPADRARRRRDVQGSPSSSAPTTSRSS
nr:hypothetical protein [Nocardioides sp. B-3]